MEKKTPSEKEKYLTILLCVLGAASAFYTGICHYAGWIGKMESVSYTHLTLPTISDRCRSRWSPYH